MRKTPPLIPLEMLNSLVSFLTTELVPISIASLSVKVKV